MESNKPTRTRIVALRLTDAEYAQLAGAAMIDDRQVSSFVRIHIMATARQVLEGSPSR